MRLIKILLLPILLITNIYTYTGRTFFMPRPIQQDIVLQKVSSHEFVKNFTGNFKILGTTFYKESTNSSDLAKYFFPGNKTELTIQGPGVAGTPDISSSWLAITDDQENFIENFSSKIKINPKQQSFGLNLQLFKNLNFINKRIIISASFPFMQVQTDLNFNEYDKSVQLEKLPLDISNKFLAANATEAFDHSLLHYAKLKDGVQKLAGLADIKLALEGLLKINSRVDINVSVYGVIPTGYKPRMKYLFEPIVGNGKHFGLGANTTIDIKIWKHKNKKIKLIGGIDYQYLFENDNKRTFDLIKNGSWSRYLDARRDGGLGFVDLTNITTLNVDVTPRSNINSFLTFLYKHKHFSLQLGYNLWWRNSEKLKLKENLDEIYAITGISTIIGFNPKAYYLNATIKDNGINHPNNAFSAITKDDLNLASGRISEALSNKFSLNIGFDGKISNSKYWINAGSSYEIASKNSALSMWELNLQTGISI